MVTEAGVHPAVKHVVYLCALALDQHESVAAMLVDDAAALSHEGRPDIAEGLSIHDDGTSTVSPLSAAACFYNDCDPETVTWALAKLGPHPMENFGQTPSALAWRERPSTYVVCSEDMVIHPDLQAGMAKRCTQSYLWPTSHSPFASEPQRVGGLLVELAGSWTD